MLVISVFALVGYFVHESENGHLAKGLLGLVIGFILTFYPGVSIQISVLMISTWLLTIGLFKVIIGIKKLGEGCSSKIIACGFIAVIAAVILLTSPAWIIETLGAFAVLEGAIGMLGAFCNCKKK
jgi:uncharacterized membrane protein HdeD (DUF308 family)